MLTASSTLSLSRSFDQDSSVLMSFRWNSLKIRKSFGCLWLSFVFAMPFILIWTEWQKCHWGGLWLRIACAIFNHLAWINLNDTKRYFQIFYLFRRNNNNNDNNNHVTMFTLPSSCCRFAVLRLTQCLCRDAHLICVNLHKKKTANKQEAQAMAKTKNESNIAEGPSDFFVSFKRRLLCSWAIWCYLIKWWKCGNVIFTMSIKITFLHTKAIEMVVVWVECAMKMEIDISNKVAWFSIWWRFKSHFKKWQINEWVQPHRQF